MLVAASILFFFLYVVGIPLTFMWVLLHCKKKNMLNDGVVMGRIGFLYARYEPSWYWWEVCRHQITECCLLAVNFPVLGGCCCHCRCCCGRWHDRQVWLLVRRFMFCLVQVVFVEAPHLQCIAGIIVAASSAVLQFSARPFQNGTLDLLDCTAMTTITVYIACGLALEDLQMNEHTVALLQHTLLLITLLTLGAAVVITLLDVNGARNAEQIQDAVKKKIAKCVPLLRTRLCENVLPDGTDAELRVFCMLHGILHSMLHCIPWNYHAYAKWRVDDAIFA